MLKDFPLLTEIHVNKYGHMQLDSVTVETILVATAHVLSFQEQPLPLLMAIITTMNQEQVTL